MRLATRGSPLALAQAESVRRLLEGAFGESVEVEAVSVETAGDRRRDVPIHAIGGQGVFAKEVDRAVLEGRAEAAVHSAKDLPGSDVLGLPIVATPRRADARDALVGSTLAGLAPGATVASGSVRRRAQLAWLRPDLSFAELRGNLDTRLSKVPPGGAVVVAAAALERLGRSGLAAEILSPALMLPQIGQGTIAVCAPLGSRAAALLKAVDDGDTHLALDAERAYLDGVGGGCTLPVAAYATLPGDGSIRLEAMLATLDGHAMVREEARGSDAARLGAELASRVLGRSGGSALLERVGRAPWAST
jgi:hydroxymethylbilane synthase